MMKRFYLIAAFMATAGLALAGMNIPSENAVGFVEVDSFTSGAATVLTIPFEACLGGGNSGMLSDLVSTNGLISSADNAAQADQIVVLIRDGNDLAYNYYWLKTGAGWTGIETAELMPDGSETGRNPPDADEFEIARGLGFWLKRPVGSAQATVYLKGQVPTGDQSTAIVPGLNLVGISSLEQLSINGGIDWTGAFGGDPVAPYFADKLMVPNGTGGFKDYYYFKKPAGQAYEEYEEWDEKWLEVISGGALQPTSDTLEIGKGFWYLRRADSGFDLEP